MFVSNFEFCFGIKTFRVPQKECGKRSSITFFRFRDAFGHFSVTFSDASVSFFRHFFAELLLPSLLLQQGETLQGNFVLQVPP